MKWLMEPCFQVVSLTSDAPKMSFFYPYMCIFRPLTQFWYCPFYRVRKIYFLMKHFTRCVLPITHPDIMIIPHRDHEEIIMSYSCSFTILPILLHCNTLYGHTLTENLIYPILPILHQNPHFNLCLLSSKYYL